MRRPLRFQIMLPLLLVAVVSLTAVGALNALLAERRTRSQIEQQLRGVVGVLNTSNFPLTDAVLQKLRDLSGAEFVLVNPAGTVVADSLDTIDQSLPHLPAIASTSRVELGPTAFVAGRSYFHTLVDLPVRAEGGRKHVLHVLFPQEQYREAWRQAFLPPLAVGVIAVAGVAIVASMLASRIGKSTASLSAEVLRLARGDFTAIHLPPTDDEIRDLAIAVNRTAQMLADYEHEVRRTERMRTVAMLGASLAHQMRNAATGCRMALDLHAADCRQPAGDECLDVAKRQLRLMEKLLQTFLQIGKQPTRLVLENSDLAALVEDVLPLIRPAARHASVQFDWLPPGDRLWARVDSEAIGQVVVNLLLNAVEAAQQRTADSAQRCVTVHLSAADDDTAELIVCDTGPGPAESVAASLFEPFTTSKAEGAGLGLAVAKQVVAAHCGSIDWNRENGLTRFRVTLPLAAKGLSDVENPDC